MSTGTEEAKAFAEETLAVARQARLDFTIFRHNVGSPGEDASVARLLWLRIPEMAKQLGAKLDADEGYGSGINSPPQQVSMMTASDVAQSRPYSDWLDCHIKAETKELFRPAFGQEGNRVDKLIALHARELGYDRTDILQMERLDGRRRDGVPAEPAIDRQEMNKGASAISRRAFAASLNQPGW